MKNLAIAFIALLFIASCGDKKTDPIERKVTSVAIAPSSLSVAVGLTQQLTATVEPADVPKKEVFWRSSNEKTATVDATGKVTGVEAGVAIITATAKDRRPTQRAVTNKVNPKKTSLVIVPANPSVGVGGKRTLTAVVLPANAVQSVTWTSSDPSKATIDASTGTVTGVALGSVAITATVADGGSIAGTATLTVNSTVIALGDEHLTVEVAAGGTFTLAHAPRTVASDIKAVRVHIAAAANAVIKAGNTIFTSGNTVDFTAPVTFTVTAQDGTAKSYTVGITAYHAVANPYGIYTVKHLADVANGLTANFLLKNNIDLPNTDAAGAAATGTSDYADAGWLPLGPFTGTFDGGNFSINNFYVNRRADYVGLFSELGKGGTIKDLGVTGVIRSKTSSREGFTDRECTGILAGLNEGTIDKCHATGGVYYSSSQVNAFVGGLVGVNHRGTISNSYTMGDMSSFSPSVLGGLVGWNEEGTISNSYATGNVSSSDASYTGGLAGNNVRGTISNSYATGNVSSPASYAGGLAGQNDEGSISDSYATGSVSSSASRVGGLVGYNNGGRISNSYAAGNVSSFFYSYLPSSSEPFTYTGGLVGDNNGGHISNSYATGSVSSSSHYYTGGLAGSNRGRISNSYAMGNVSSSAVASNAGGLAGINRNNISNSYATGNVSASATTSSKAGGLVGYSDGEGSISNSYATGNVSSSSASSSKAGGLAGDNNSGTYANCHRNRNAAITKNNADAAPDDADIPGIAAKTKADMQTDTFKGILNGTGTVWGREGGRNEQLPYIIGVGVGK